MEPSISWQKGRRQGRQLELSATPGLTRQGPWKNDDNNASKKIVREMAARSGWEKQGIYRVYRVCVGLIGYI